MYMYVQKQSYTLYTQFYKQNIIYTYIVSISVYKHMMYTCIYAYLLKISCCPTK